MYSYVAVQEQKRSRRRGGVPFHSMHLVVGTAFDVYFPTDSKKEAREI
jgi:hypothetical protein